MSLGVCETEAHYITQVGLDLMLGSSRIHQKLPSSCLILPNAERAVMYCETQILILFLFPQEPGKHYSLGSWGNRGLEYRWVHSRGHGVSRADQAHPSQKGAEQSRISINTNPAASSTQGSSGRAGSEASPRPTDCQTGPICCTNGSFMLPKASSHPPLGAPR